MKKTKVKLETVEDALKRAMILEINGKEFFKMAAKTAESDVSREFFEHMVKEEEHHLSILEITFKNLLNEGKVVLPTEEELEFKFDDPIIDKDFLVALKTSRFDSAAISIALTFEEKAFKFYQEAEKNTEDPEAKKLFRWLVEWEIGHHQTLLDLEEDYRQEVWNDSNFWPM